MQVFAWIIRFWEDTSWPASIPTAGATRAARHGIDIPGPLPDEPETSGKGRREAHPGGDRKALNRRWITAFNERDWETERAVRGDDFRAILSGAPAPLGNDAWSGFLKGFVNAFPDSIIQIEDCIAEGDTVVTRWSLNGTHRGEFQGIPATGRTVRFDGTPSVSGRGCGLQVANRGYGVPSHGSMRGKIACQQRHRSEERDDGDDGDRIVRADSI